MISGSELPVFEKLKKEVDGGQINIFYSWEEIYILTKHIQRS